jgi:hypothetical protein
MSSLVIGFIELLQNVTTSNYSTVANSPSAIHNSTHKVFSVCCVFTSRCLVTVSNGERSPYSGSRPIPVPQLPAFNSNNSQRLNCSSPLAHSLTHRLAPLHCTVLTLTVVVITSRHGLHRKHLSSVAVQLLLVRNLLPSSGRCLQSRVYVPQYDERRM